MSRKRARSPSPVHQVFKSHPIEDRSSTFIAAYSPTSSAESLQALPEFRDATHRMTAWRLPSKQQSLNSKPMFETKYDDDGENHGGKSLEKALIAKDVTGVIMVARWYGGVMLGPVRFDHIRNCANNAIASCVQESERAAKKAKTDAERLQLIETLQERDQSISVLRDLLAEKKRGTASSQENVVPSSPSKVPQYTTMDMTVLGRLEAVRDKTIGWILSQIEQVERKGNAGD